MTAPALLPKKHLLAGLRCPKRLWWLANESGAPELKPDAIARDRFDQGRQAGELARQYVPGGQLIGVQFISLDERLLRTRQAIEEGATVLYEAGFAADGAYVQPDIIERLADGWRLIEVKSSNSVKPEHVADLAVQVHVARRAGLEIREIQLMHLNKTCRFPDLKNLFIRANVTADVNAFAARLSTAVATSVAVVSGALPEFAVGDHCWKPGECDFLDRCHPAVPADHVETLYKLSPKKRKALAELGVERLPAIPGDFDLSDIQARQKQAVAEKRLVVLPTLAAVVEAFRAPLAFLDFETISRAIPVWDRCAPWDQVPAQFSCHVLLPDNSIRHYEWLANEPVDPRRALAEALIEACRGANHVLAYYVQFEKSRIEELAWLFPDLKEDLYGIADRLRDLLPIVREHVYHSSFGGSFSLKAVAPALLGIDYGALEIGSGGEATLAIARLLMTTDVLAAEERAELRGHLLKYCKQDTWCLVKLLERLRDLARDA